MAILPDTLERGGGMTDRLLTTTEAAERLGTTRRTLEAWRLTGEGPTFRKLGARMVRDSPEDLTAFVEAGARLNTAGGTPQRLWQVWAESAPNGAQRLHHAHTAGRVAVATAS